MKRVKAVFHTYAVYIHAFIVPVCMTQFKRISQRICTNHMSHLWPAGGGVGPLDPHRPATPMCSRFSPGPNYLTLAVLQIQPNQLV